MSILLVIGNKPYKKFEMGKVIDTFENNVRCNLGIPNHNNSGQVFGELALCNHLYDNLISKNITKKDAFYGRYKHAFLQKETEDVFEDFRKHRNKFTKIYYAKPAAGKYNNFLSKNGCPLRFRKQPRTGISVVMEKIISGKQVFVTNFTIENSEKRASFYTKVSDSAVHSAEEEIAILRWLHQAGKVDASLCLVEDREKLSFKDCGLKPTDFIKKRLALAGLEESQQ